MSYSQLSANQSLSRSLIRVALCNTARFWSAKHVLAVTESPSQMPGAVGNGSFGALVTPSSGRPKYAQPPPVPKHWSGRICSGFGGQSTKVKAAGRRLEGGTGGAVGSCAHAASSKEATGIAESRLT